MTALQPWGLTDRGPKSVENLLTTIDRLTAWAAWFDLTPPPLTYTRGRPKGAGTLLLTDALLDWILTSGGSIEWFLSGDVRRLAASSRRQEMQSRDFAKLLERYDATERQLLLKVMASGKRGDELQEELAAFRVAVDERRAQAAAVAAAAGGATTEQILDARIAYHVEQVTGLLRARAPEGSAVESVGWRVGDDGAPCQLAAWGWAEGQVSGAHRMEYEPALAEGWVVREAPRLHLGGEG